MLMGLGLPLFLRKVIWDTLHSVMIRMTLQFKRNAELFTQEVTRFSESLRSVQLRLRNSYSPHTVHPFIVVRCGLKFDKTSLQDLQVAYNNIFRLLMNLPYRCRVSPHFIALGVNHFSVIRRKLVHSSYQRILLSNNSLISTLVRCNQMQAVGFLFSRLMYCFKSLVNCESPYIIVSF